MNTYQSQKKKMDYLKHHFLQMNDLRFIRLLVYKQKTVSLYE